MRSGTYVHPGERLTCQGCHEPKHRPPLPLEAHRRWPCAARRRRFGPTSTAPIRSTTCAWSSRCSTANCVACHREKKAVDLSRTVEGRYGWTRSYTNLAAKYGFYFHVTNGSINTGVHGGSRTIPGGFGARASKLMKYLGPEHYGVRLSAEELHRITLWLDCNSEFYGSYENTAAQARGEVVLPTLN